MIHQRLALVAHDVGEPGVAEHTADRRIQDVAELVVGAVRRLHRLVELQQVDDAVAQERVDLDARVVGGQHLLVRRFQVEDLVRRQDHVLDQRQLEVQPRIGDEAAAADRLAEAQHQRLLGLRDLERAGQRQEQRDDDGGHDAEQAVVPRHGFASCRSRRGSGR